MAPLDMYKEKNTGNNLPAQIEIYATDGDAYQFLFMAKGGGSANKSLPLPGDQGAAEPGEPLTFLDEKLRTLGTAACPPYHLAIVIGGTSAEYTLKVAKLASARYLDTLPDDGQRSSGAASAIVELEAAGARAHAGRSASARSSAASTSATTCASIRLPRHGASLPGRRSRSRARPTARRSARSRATACSSSSSRPIPAKYLPEVTDERPRRRRRADRSQPADGEIRATLSQYPVKTRLSLTGPMVVARDIAHAKIKERLDAGEGMPQYLQRLSASTTPARRRRRRATRRARSGRRRPGRMDTYVDQFQAHGGSFVMLAKGNRSSAVTDACKKHGGFYLGSIGGPAARLAKDCIKKVEVLEYPELGMEAVWKIEVVDFPAFIVVDDKGNDFFEDVSRPVSLSLKP